MEDAARSVARKQSVFTVRDAIRKRQRAAGYEWEYDDAAEDLEGELWRDVPTDVMSVGHQVSNFGRIKTKAGRILKTLLSGNGYVMVTHAATTVHAIVMRTWVPEGWFEGCEINHINLDKTDNRLENLEYVTHQRNVQHAHEEGTHGKDKPVLQVDDTGAIVKRFPSAAAAARAVGAPYQRMTYATREAEAQSVVAGFRWFHEEAALQAELDAGTFKRAFRVLYKFSADGTVHKRFEFESAPAAARELGIEVKHIKTALRTRKEFDGYYWAWTRQAYEDMVETVL